MAAPPPPPYVRIWLWGCFNYYCCCHKAKKGHSKLGNTNSMQGNNQPQGTQLSLFSLPHLAQPRSKWVQIFMFIPGLLLSQENKQKKPTEREIYATEVMPVKCIKYGKCLQNETRFLMATRMDSKGNSSVLSPRHSSSFCLLSLEINGTDEGQSHSVRVWSLAHPP